MVTVVGCNLHLRYVTTWSLFACMSLPWVQRGFPAGYRVARVILPSWHPIGRYRWLPAARTRVHVSAYAADGSELLHAVVACWYFYIPVVNPWVREASPS